VLTDGYVSQVDECCCGVRIDIDCLLQATVIIVAAGLEGVGNVPQLTQRELVWAQAINLLGLIEREVTYVERYLVVRATQVRIDVLQQILVLLGIGLLDLPLAWVWLYRLVVDDRENLVTVRQNE
jgi:hypothetical protein